MLYIRIQFHTHTHSHIHTGQIRYFRQESSQTRLIHIIFITVYINRTQCIYITFETISIGFAFWRQKGKDEQMIKKAGVKEIN